MFLNVVLVSMVTKHYELQYNLACRISSVFILVYFFHKDYLPLKEKLEKAGVPLEFYEYEAAHAFTNPESPNYKADACALSLQRLYQFMNAHLA